MNARLLRDRVTGLLVATAAQLGSPVYRARLRAALGLVAGRTPSDALLGRARLPRNVLASYVGADHHDVGAALLDVLRGPGLHGSRQRLARALAADLPAERIAVRRGIGPTGEAGVWIVVSR